MAKASNPLGNNPLFGPLPIELSENLRSLNPWWQNEPGPQLPVFRRWPYKRLKHLLSEGLTPAVVLRGPRRVGKTILIRQIIESLIAETVPGNHILYVPFDDLPSFGELQEPILAIARWFEKEILKQSFNQSARSGQKIFVFFDEVQNLDFWAEQVKNLVDNHSLHALLTGSSSLRIEAGRDSLAGRITTLDLGPLLLREIAGLRFNYSEPAFWNGNEFDQIAKPDFWLAGREHAQNAVSTRKETFKTFSERGAYPIAHERADTPWPEVAAYLNETVIKRAIQHDLRMGKRGQKRDEKLLEEVFRLCCRYAGQTPSQSVLVPEIRQSYDANIGPARISQYMKFLDGTLLIRLINPLELRLKRKKSSSKICLCDHALRASWLQEVVPLDVDGLLQNSHLTDLAGHLAESVLGYFLASIPNLEVAHFPTRSVEPEVDFILTVGTRRIPVEVKYRRRIDSHDDTRGLRAFIEKTVYDAPFGLLVTLDDQVRIDDPRIIPISLSSLLWLR